MVSRPGVAIERGGQPPSDTRLLAPIHGTIQDDGWPRTLAEMEAQLATRQEA